MSTNFPPKKGSKPPFHAQRAPLQKKYGAQVPPRAPQPRQSKPAPDGLWLYGIHPVRAALANPLRKIKKFLLTAGAAEQIGSSLLAKVAHEIVTPDAVARCLPAGAVHQGVALSCAPLPQRQLDEVLSTTQGRRIVLVLDQVTDPHNAGAILRSAAAFGVNAVVLQDRNTPPESGVLSKSASGALDIVPIVSVVNLSRALEELGEMGFYRIAMAGDGEKTLKEAAEAKDIALVLGSEGSGIRRLVREHCDTAAFVPISDAMESLNVSNAAAIALYELRR